jgi:phage shock protein A
VEGARHDDEGEIVGAVGVRDGDCRIRGHPHCESPGVCAGELLRIDSAGENGKEANGVGKENHMGLLERVSTLLRANLNDMIDRAEDPDKMIKQVILDMDNQYLQVKTQVAVSIADQHMLEKKLKENEDTGNDWMRKAERAVDKGEDDLARAALDRYQTSLRLAQSYREQVSDQKAQVETLKGALQKLEQKLDEAKAKRDLLLARHRRSIALGKAARAETAIGDQSNSASFDRLKDRVHHTEAVAIAEVELIADDAGERLTRMDRDVEIDRLLADLKARRRLHE